MGMLPTLVEGKQMTQYCEMAPSHFRLHLVKATPHFRSILSAYCMENDHRRLPHLQPRFSRHFLTSNDYLRARAVTAVNENERLKANSQLLIPKLPSLDNFLSFVLEQTGRKQLRIQLCCILTCQHRTYTLMS